MSSMRFDQHLGGRAQAGEMTKTAAEGPCIVCGHSTPDKSHGGGFSGARRYSHWRCGDGEECAVRRNAGKRRPRPEAEVRAEWRARHPEDRGWEVAS